MTTIKQMLEDLDAPSRLGGVISSADFKVGDRVVIMDNYSNSFGYRATITGVKDGRVGLDVDNGNKTSSHWTLLKHCL